MQIMGSGTLAPHLHLCAPPIPARRLRLAPTSMPRMLKEATAMGFGFLHTITGSSRASSVALQCPHRCFPFRPSQRACSANVGSPDRHVDDLPLEESTLLWRKHQFGFATEEEMQNFFGTRSKRVCELSDAVSHLIAPRFDLIGGLKRFRVEPDEKCFVIWDDDGTEMEKTNDCDKLIKAGKCVEEVFDQSIYELGRNVLQCLGEGQGMLVEGIPHFVKDTKEQRLLIPKHSKVALDSSLIMYLLQPAPGRVKEPKEENSLTSSSKLACSLPPKDQDLARKKEILLQVFSKPFFFVMSEYSLSVEIPSGMLDRQNPRPTSEEREKLFAAWTAFTIFFAQYVTVAYGERGMVALENLVELLGCNHHSPYSSTYRGKVLLDSIGPEVHLMLVGDHEYHGKIFRGIREGTMRSILMWCPFSENVAYYHKDGTVAMTPSSL